MMDAQDQINDTTPETITIDALGVKGNPDHSVISLSAEDQEQAVKRLGAAVSLMLASDVPVERVVKSAYLTVVGSLVNVALLVSVADVRAFVTEMLLPSLDKLAEVEPQIRAEADKAAAEAALRDAEPAGNA